MDLARLRAECARLKMERDILKKATAYFARETLKYAWIARHKAQWPVTLTCEVLGVSTSGYFGHWQRLRADKPGQPGTCISDAALLVHIRAIHAEVKAEYGWSRMWKKLLARCLRIGNERVRRLMQRYGIKARGKRKFVVTTDSRYDLPIAPNLLARNFTPEAPNQVIDLFSRPVVGWSMREHMQASVVTDALRMAWFRPGLPLVSGQS